MSALRDALESLNLAILRLENTAETVEASRKGEQRDMFSSPMANNTNAPGFPSALVAKRLDSAIEKVEKILEESKPKKTAKGRGK